MEAQAFIRDLPPEFARIYVDEWDEAGWRFLFGDQREHAARTLDRLKPPGRIRIRAE